MSSKNKIMTDSMDDLKQKLIDCAVELLLSKEIQELIKEGKNKVHARFGDLPADTRLHKIAAQAKMQLIPVLEKIQPRLVSTMGGRGVEFIKNWIHTYIKHEVSTKKSKKSLAKYYSRKFMKDAISDYYSFKEITPLINFSAEREFSLSNNDIDPKVAYRFLKHDFRQHVRALCFHPALFSPDMDGDMADRWPYDWIVIAEQRIPRKKEFIGDKSIMHGFFTNQILDVMRLFKDQEFRTINSYGSLSTFLFAGQTFVHRGDFFAAPFGEDYYLSEREIKELGKYWRKTKKYIPFDKILPSNIEMAIRYFRVSEKKPLHERFLDLAISLEALFLIESENTYRLPIRVSTFLYGHDSKAIDIYKNVREIWSLRNNIAHGNFNMKDKRKWNELKQKTPNLRSVVRKSINKHLELFSILKNEERKYKDFMKHDFEKKYVVGNGS